MMKNNRIYTVAMISALMMGLTGCGGGGSSQSDTTDSTTILDTSVNSRTITLNTENYYKEFYTSEENKSISLIVDEDSISTSSLSNVFENGYTKLSLNLSSIISDDSKNGRFHNLFYDSTEEYKYIPKAAGGYFEQRVVHNERLYTYIDNINTSANLSVENIYNNGSYQIIDNETGGIDINIEIYTEEAVNTKLKYEIVKTTSYHDYDYVYKTRLDLTQHNFS
jgi:hypothetical protein